MAGRAFNGGIFEQGCNGDCNTVPAGHYEHIFTARYCRTRAGLDYPPLQFELLTAVQNQPIGELAYGLAPLQRGNLRQEVDAARVCSPDAPSVARLRPVTPSAILSAAASSSDSAMWQILKPRISLR